MKKVIFIGLDIYSQTGGIGRYTRRLLRALGELTGRTIAPCMAISLWDGVEHIPRAPQSVHFIPCNRNRLLAVWNFAYLSLSRRPGVIIYGHILFAPLAILGRVLCPRAKHILFIYGVEVWGAGYRPTLRWERWLVQHCFDRIITISRHTQKQMVKTYGVNEGRFELLAPAVDIDQIEPQSDQGKLPEQKSLLTVCRLTPEDRYKGVDRVLQALHQVLKVFPDVRYNVVGEGALRDELEHLTLEMGLGEHVHFLGYLSEVELQQVYARSSIFVMPSFGEGFGIVFIEAFLHRLPVICGNADASVEVVTNGYNGITVNPHSSMELAEAILELLSKPELARKMGEKGCQTVFDRYTHPIFRQTLEKILLEE